jgi:hypothetical protein
MRSQRRLAFTFEGLNFNASESQVVFPGAVKVKKTIPAVPASQRDKELTTRTNESSGVITAGTGHTIAANNADVVDVYWTGGRRFGMTTEVNDLAITVNGGSGDNLPALNTDTMSLMKQIEMPECYFDGDETKIFGAFYKNPGSPTARAHVDLQDGGGESVEDFDILEERAAGGRGLDHIINIKEGDDNPFEGDVVEEARGSHDAATEGTMFILVGQGTP